MIHRLWFAFAASILPGILAGLASKTAGWLTGGACFVLVFATMLLLAGRETEYD
jgi:hypothetical protein